MVVTRKSDAGASHLKAIADYLPSPVYYCDRALVYRYVNPAGAAWHGREIEEVVDRHVSEIMAAGQVALLKPRHDAVLDGRNLKFEESRQFGDGVPRRVQTDYVPHVDDTGAVVGFFVMLTDVTVRYESEVAAREASAQIQMVSDAVPAQICFLDRDRRYIWANRTTAAWFATDLKNIIGRTAADVYGEAFAARTQPDVDKVLAGRRIESESRYAFPDGKERDVKIAMIPNVRAGGRIDGYFLIAHDVTDYKRTEQELWLLATTDPLTGVANRRHVLTQCEEEILRSRRYDRPVSLVMCDLDHFKSVNDRFGHAAGDAVLRAFSATARSVLREGIDTIGRFGGEEFLLLLPQTGVQSARLVAERLRRRCAGIEIPSPWSAARVTCSFGVTALADDDGGVDGFLRRADAALYRAKDAGRDRVVVSEDPPAQVPRAVARG